MTNAEARCNKSLRPRKPEGSLGRTAQDVHLDSHTAPELFCLHILHCYSKGLSWNWADFWNLKCEYLPNYWSDLSEINCDGFSFKSPLIWYTSFSQRHRAIFGCCIATVTVWAVYMCHGWVHSLTFQREVARLNSYSLVFRSDMAAECSRSKWCYLEADIIHGLPCNELNLIVDTTPQFLLAPYTSHQEFSTKQKQKRLFFIITISLFSRGKWEQENNAAHPNTDKRFVFWLHVSSFLTV